MKRVTDTDLGRFSYAGFNTPVPDAEHPTSEQLFRSASRALESPAARLMKAVYRVVVTLAERGELDGVQTDALSEDARRRLGYISERAATSEVFDPRVCARLARFTERLFQPEYRSKPSLTVIANSTDSYLRILEERGDGINEKWKVYGDVEPLD